MKKTRKTFSIVLSIVMVLSMLSLFGITTSAANTPYRSYDLNVEEGSISLKIDAESNSDSISNPYYFECCRFDLFMIATDSPIGLDPASNKDYNYCIVVRNDGYPTATDGAGVTKNGLTFSITLNTLKINKIKNFSAENPYVWLVIRPCSLANGLDNAYDENSNSMGFYHNKAASCKYFDSAVCLGRYDSLEDFQGVKPVKESGVIDVDYTPAKSTTNTYDVTVIGRPNMVQFISLDHGNGTLSRSFDRRHEKVSIVSYDINGEAVSDTSKNIAYEIWTITTSISEDTIGARVKEAGSSKWEDLEAAYIFENEYVKADSDLVSAELASTEGAAGPVSFTVVAGQDAQYVQVKNEENGSCTLSAAKAVDNGDGTLTFTGRIYANGSGEKTMTVRILDTYGWKTVDTLTYIIK